MKAIATVVLALAATSAAAQPVNLSGDRLDKITAGTAGTTTPSGIAPGGGLGIPQAMGNQVPPGVLNGNAQVPAWSAIGAPSTPGVSGSIVGGGSTGPSGVTSAGSPNNPGVNQPFISHGP